MVEHFDIIVIGAGIAGASVAAELQKTKNVLMLEMEAHPGYHTTGRSAAVFAEAYGPGPIRALTRAAYAFYRSPPSGFTENALLQPRGGLFIANHGQLDRLESTYEELSSEQAIKRLDAGQVRALCPLLKPDYAAAGLLDERAMDIDVHALHDGYLRQFRAAGGSLLTRAEAKSLTYSSRGWSVQSNSAEYGAPIVVNAAGAWADVIAQRAGVAPIGLVPKRRTALIVAAPKNANTDTLPLTIDIDEQFYLKPDAGRLLLSPANEDPEPPGDTQAHELDIALCVDRIQSAFELDIQRIENSWAGLRSFVTDKSPVCGYDASHAGFFWLAGQGGYGVQSAPALARTAAALILEQEVPEDILAEGLVADSLAPQRLR